MVRCVWKKRVWIGLVIYYFKIRNNYGTIIWVVFQSEDRPNNYLGRIGS